MVELKIEPWNEFVLEADALARSHFSEVEGEMEKNRPYDPDWGLLGKLVELGALLVVGARDSGVLVGYCLWTMENDPESKNTRIAKQGPWYHAPGARIGARRIIQFSLGELRSRGVQAVFLHHRMLGRGAKLASLYESLGAREIQRTFYLWAGG